MPDVVSGVGLEPTFHFAQSYLLDNERVPSARLELALRLYASYPLDEPEL